MNRIIALCYTRTYTIQRVIHTSRDKLDTLPVVRTYDQGSTKFRMHFDGKNSLLVKYSDNEITSLTPMDIFRYGKVKRHI